MPNSAYEAQLEAIKQKMPPVEELYSRWPAERPALPAGTWTRGVLYETTGFEDPRLVLYTAITELPAVTIGWCLLGAMADVPEGRTPAPNPPRHVVRDLDALRVMQLLAVDQQETEEAAIAALADPTAVRALAEMAAAVHHQRQLHDQPMLVEFGTPIYAHHRGPVQFGTTSVDAVCIGSPIWIAALDDESKG